MSSDEADELPSTSNSSGDIWEVIGSDNNLVPLLLKPEGLLTSLLGDDDSSETAASNGYSSAKQMLVKTSQDLFRFIEKLASMETKLKDAKREQRISELNDIRDGAEEGAQSDDELEDPSTLSGLSSLFTGQAEESLGDESAGADVDFETIWGQVDLQNTALLPMLKKMTRKLAKRAIDEDSNQSDLIRLLDGGSDSEDEQDGGESEGSVASELDDDAGDNDDDNHSEDSDARRIRERMEKTMADMDDMDEMEDGFGDLEEKNVVVNGHEDKLATIRAKVSALEDAIDPTREDMRDGFFDLHEMEAFADEEEEYLPDSAYGEEAPDDDQKSEKMLPHIKDRTGKDSDEGSEDSDESGEDELTKRYETSAVRRKKYRADDEVDALYGMYDEVGEGGDNFDDSDSDESNEAGASEMTAADLFGQPDKKLMDRYSKKKSTKKPDVSAPAVSRMDDDNESWDDHKFEEDGEDWKEEMKGPDVGSDDDGEDEADQGKPDADDQHEEPAMVSAHGIRAKKLEEQTLKLEEDMMAEKPWKMLGEAKGVDRAVDSLLDSTPEFEVAFKPMPILTQEHSVNIEEMIKKRIIDEDWDDVVPRELPDIGGGKRGGEAPEVSQEKSKLGLGELYEREYLKKTTGFDRDAHEKETEEDAAKEEMKRLFANLCSQLDALSNYHFAPRPVAEEADVQNRDVPAIAMEEVLPLHVSNSRSAAPEEVFGGGKGRQSVLRGESEMDQTARKSARNAKKKARRKDRQQKLADEKLISKLQPGLGLNNPYEKRKLREELQMARASGKVVSGVEDEAGTGKEYQTSTKFFAKMQESVEASVHGEPIDRQRKKRKGLENGQGSSVYKL